MTSEVLPAPELPTSAMVSPGRIVSETSVSASRSLPAYLSETRSKRSSPRARSILTVPLSGSSSRSSIAKMDSAAARPRWIDALMPDRAFRRSSSVSRAAV